MSMNRTDGSTPAFYNIYEGSNTLRVSTPQNTPLGFAHGRKDRLFQCRKPFLTFHKGADETGPIVAHVEYHIGAFTRQWKYCMGNPHEVSPTAWKYIHPGGYANSRIIWQVEIEKDGVRKQHHLAWKRTSHVFVEDVAPSSWSKLCHSSYKLVNVQTSQIHAACTFYHRKSAKLQIHNDYGDDFNITAIAILLAVLDNARREAQAGG